MSKRIEQRLPQSTMNLSPLSLFLHGIIMPISPLPYVADGICPGKPLVPTSSALSRTPSLCGAHHVEQTGILRWSLLEFGWVTPNSPMNISWHRDLPLTVGIAWCLSRYVTYWLSAQITWNFDARASVLMALPDLFIWVISYVMTSLLCRRSSLFCGVQDSSLWFDPHLRLCLFLVLSPCFFSSWLGSFSCVAGVGACCVVPCATCPLLPSIFPICIYLYTICTTPPCRHWMIPCRMLCRSPTHDRWVSYNNNNVAIR